MIISEFGELLKAYKKMFSMVDCFHFNSQNTADVYGRYLDIPSASKVIPITHSGIHDRRKMHCYDERLLRLGFIGSEAPYKGLPILKNVIEQLNREGYTDKVALYVYGGRTCNDEKLPNVFYKGRYTSAMMEQVFDNMDLLVVPSIWHETFSLVTLEALSYGTCVLVSDKVGAKDVVSQYTQQFVFDTKQNLHNVLKDVIDDRSILLQYNNAVVSSPWPWSMKNHAKEIVDKIYK